jgi:hypothetical protein
LGHNCTHRSGKGAGEFRSSGVNGSIANTQSLPTVRTLQIAGIETPIEQRPFQAEAELTPLFMQKIVTGGGYEIRFVNTWENVHATGATTRAVDDPHFESGFEIIFQQPLLRNFGIAVNTAPIRQAQNAEQFAEQSLLQTLLNTVFGVQSNYWSQYFASKIWEPNGSRKGSRRIFCREQSARGTWYALLPSSWCRPKRG